MDKSISIESVKNSASIDPVKNRLDVKLVKIESIYGFIAPVQVTIERKEVG